MAENGSEHQRATTLSNTAGLQSSVFVNDYGYIPMVVANAAYVIEKNIRTKGLFQTKGTASNAMTKLMTRSNSSSLKTINVHDAVEALKTFLSSLPDPLLPHHVLESLISVPTNADPSQYVSVLREFRKCWPYNFAVLHLVLALLSKVSKHSLQNGADVPTLAVVFVFDFIRPLQRENSETTGDASDMMQRLPFIITAMETLIENPELFKMAVVVGDDLILEFEREHYKAELMSAAKECSHGQPVICPWRSNTTYTRPLPTESPQTSAISAPNDPTPFVDTVQPGQQEVAVASTVDNRAEINAMNLGEIQSVATTSTAAAFTPVVNNEINLLAPVSEVSAVRERVLKTSKLKSSPSRKPVRASRPKKAGTTRRPKVGTPYSNKRVAREVVEEKSDPSPTFGRLQLQENIPGSEKSCNTDDTNSTMLARRRCPKIADADSRTLEDLVDDEKIAEHCNNSFQRFHDGQEPATNNDRDPLTVIPDNRECADPEKDSVILNKLEKVDGKVLKVSKKGTKHRSKGTLKKKRKKLKLKSGNMFNVVGCLSISPMPVKSKDPQQRVEPISRTSSSVLASPSTQDKTTTIAGTNIRDSISGHSDHFNAAEYPQIHHRTHATTSHCENNKGHSSRSYSPDCCTSQPAHSCSPGCSTRHPTDPSDGHTNCARCFVSGNDQEQPSGKKVVVGKNSARLRNEILGLRQSPFLECTSCTNDTPTNLKQIIIVKVITDLRRKLSRARPRAAENQSPVAAEQLQNDALPEQSPLDNLMAKIFAMSVILFTISLVLYYLS